MTSRNNFSAMANRLLYWFFLTRRTRCSQYLWESTIRARSSSFFQWVGINWALLRNSDGEEFLDRIRVGLKFRLAWIQDRIWSTAYRARQGARLNPKATDSEHVKAYVAARYKPLPYDGRVVLFQRSALPIWPISFPRFGWGGVISELEIYEMPGDHRDMFLKPHVGILAEKLAACLLAAQESSIRAL